MSSFGIVNVVTVPSVSVTVTLTVSFDPVVVVAQVTTSPPTGDVNVPESCCRPSVPKTLPVSCLASAV